MEERQLSDDFTQGNIAGKLLKFMIPILGALILQAMYGAVDLLVVGQFGTDAGISAVSTGSNIINLVTFVVTGLTMGVTVLISRYLGEQAPEKIGRVIGGAVAFFFVLTAALMAVLLIFAPVFAGWLNAPREAYDFTVTYVRICGAGLAFVVAYNVISGIFRGLGNSRLPLIFVAIACGVNILGDLLFVAVLGMNVAGAALATILAQFVSVAMSLAIIRRQRLPFALSRKDIGFNPEIKTFLKLGFPIALQDMLVNISFDSVRHRKRNRSGGFFRVWNCPESDGFCYADSFRFDAVYVGVCGPERGSRKRRTGSKGNVHRNGDRRVHRGLYLWVQFFPGRSAFSPVYLRTGLYRQVCRVLKGIQPGGGSNLSGIQLYRVF